VISVIGQIGHYKKDTHPPNGVGENILQNSQSFLD